MRKKIELAVLLLFLAVLVLLSKNLQKLVSSGNVTAKNKIIVLDSDDDTPSQLLLSSLAITTNPQLAKRANTGSYFWYGMPVPFAETITG